MIIENLQKNWRTTSLGLVAIAGAVVSLVFAIKKGNADQATWMLQITQIFNGVGLMLAGDGAASQKDHTDSTAAIQDLKQKVDATASAVQTGDTSLIARNDTSKP